MRLNFVDVYPSDCGIHDGAPLQINMDGWMGRGWLSSGPGSPCQESRFWFLVGP